MWAIIGGSGFETFSQHSLKRILKESTPYGEPSSDVFQLHLEGTSALFLSRHGEHHEMNPSQINARANIYFLKKLGVTKIFSLFTVGSLRKEIKPGDLAIATQFIDHTKSLRAQTFCEEGLVSHVSLAEPVCIPLIDKLKALSLPSNLTLHWDKTYLCMEGPAYSTKAESHLYRQMKADIIGMSAFPEYALAREAGICYVACCMVSDYDCWQEEEKPVTTDDVKQMISQNHQQAFSLLSAFLPSTASLFPHGCPELSLATGLLSDPALLSDKQKALLAFFASSKH